MPRRTHSASGMRMACRRSVGAAAGMPCSFGTRTPRSTPRFGKAPDWRDWDHLHAHYLRRRDVFLTWDGGILDCADELKGKLDIVVMRPEEYLEQHERKSTGSPG